MVASSTTHGRNVRQVRKMITVTVYFDCSIAILKV